MLYDIRLTHTIHNININQKGQCYLTLQDCLWPEILCKTELKQIEVLIPEVYRNKIYSDLYSHWPHKDILQLRMCLSGKELAQHVREFPVSQQTNQTNINM